MNRTDLGRRGESVAVELLRKSGYRILDCNVRCKLGEIDLVAQEGKTISIVEIRTRSSTSMGWPEETVTFQKQRRLIRLAQWYLKFRRLGEVPVRFDVVSILLGPDGVPARTRLIKSAFDAV